MKKYLGLVLFVSLIACSSENKQTKSVIFDMTNNIQDTLTKSDLSITFIEKENCNSCVSCVEISPEMERDSIFNSQLSSYVYECMIGGYDCDKIISSNLYLRKSFKETVLLFYSSKLDQNNVYDNKSQWDERKIELLYRCKNLKTTHYLANELLKLNMFDGIDVLWEDTDIELIPFWKEFSNKTKEPFIIMSLATIHHDKKEFSLRDSLMKRVEANDDFITEYNALQDLFKHNELITLDLFNEVIFEEY